jgi:hypothetical protein
MVYGTLLKSSVTRFMEMLLPSCWSILDDPLMESMRIMTIQSMPSASSPDMKVLFCVCVCVFMSMEKSGFYLINNHTHKHPIDILKEDARILDT